VLKQTILKSLNNKLIFSPFFAQHPREERRKLLKDQYGFNCSCEACQHDFPFLYEHQLANLTTNFDKLSSVSACNDEFKKNCEILLKAQKASSSNFELLKIKIRNLHLLAFIAKAEPFVL
jgi:hypothetical protein